MKNNLEPLILIVDDQADNLDTIMRYLKESDINYKFSRAMNGEMACKIAGKRHPNLIIMDWEMPVMNGYEALLCIKKNTLTADIPIIMATGRSSPEDLDKALKAGAADYIRKPIEKQELLARVRSCLSISCLINEIRSKNENLEDLNREKDGMVDVVAHDLKSPLNNIKGFVELIKLEGELNKAQGELLERINGVINEGFSLIVDILDAHAYDHTNSTLNISKISIKEFVLSLKDKYEQRLKAKNQLLHLGNISNSMMLRTDKSILNRILDNLITNAIKFSNIGRSIYLHSFEENNSIRFSLRDEGPGISEKDQKIMFQMFQKLSARPTGNESSSGLGLSIVKSLVEKLNGKIEVKSTLGEGTEFIITLPNN